MINQILISNVATYNTPATLSDLKPVNYIFGANGTGKTTISRVISWAEGHQQCQVNWENGSPLDVFVYNQDFVERNFNQETPVKGVFTLGDDQVEAEKEIARLQPDIDKLLGEINGLKKHLSGEDGETGRYKELTDLEPVLREQCFKQKQLHDQYFQAAFTGVRGNAEKFKTKVLAEKASNTSDLLSLDVLKEKSEIVFSKEITNDPMLTNLHADKLVLIESYEILSTPIIGEQGVDISALIEHLGNSDWVKNGIEYHNKKPDTCPFCQQSTDKQLSDEFKKFFSGAYERDIEKLKDILSNYQSEADSILYVLRTNHELNNRHLLEFGIFESEFNALKERLKFNLVILEKKIEEPSQKITLEPTGDLVTKIQGLINIANEKTVEHNSTVDDIDNEKEVLKSNIWRYVISELSGELSRYEQNKNRLTSTISGMKTGMEAKQVQLHILERKVQELEKKTTSIHPTKDAINNLLRTFGFNSFHIDIVDEHGHYKICRVNGEDASRSLSEGEKTFITFLYFYSLIKGAQSISGTTTNRVVVFDDPISSLDSDILYIVSSLMKGVVEDVRNKTGPIKQVFILTHNVYFHKEVTYSPDRNKSSLLSTESFWLVKKQVEGSIVQRCQENPIRSAYELLWEDVKAGNTSSVSLQNTLRRIIENYFTMWGGMKKDGICALFDGPERLICQSLFSWVNDGSHSIHDDLYINHGQQTNEAYLRVFKEIFVRAKQHGHYIMMSGEELTQVDNKKDDEPVLEV
jgi:wobble nucleotide-excising tRNase